MHPLRSHTLLMRKPYKGVFTKKRKKFRYRIEVRYMLARYWVISNTNLHSYVTPPMLKAYMYRESLPARKFNRTMTWFQSRGRWRRPSCLRSSSDTSSSSAVVGVNYMGQPERRERMAEERRQSDGGNGEGDNKHIVCL